MTVDYSKLSKEELLKIISEAQEQIDIQEATPDLKNKDNMLKLLCSDKYGDLIAEQAIQFFKFSNDMDIEAVKLLLKDWFDGSMDKKSITFETLNNENSGANPLAGYKMPNKSDEKISSCHESPRYEVVIRDGVLTNLYRSEGGEISVKWNSFTLFDMIAERQFITCENTQMSMRGLNCNLIHVGDRYIMPHLKYGVKFSDDGVDMGDLSYITKTINFYTCEQFLVGLFYAIRGAGYAKELDSLLERAYFDYRATKRKEDTIQSPMRFFKETRSATLGSTNRHCVFKVDDKGKLIYMFYDSSNREEITLKIVIDFVVRCLECIAVEKGMCAKAFIEDVGKRIILYAGWNESVQGSYDNVEFLLVDNLK